MKNGGFKMKLVANTIGAIALGAACIYGGMRYQQYNDSLKPYAVENREGEYVFVERGSAKEFPAAEISQTYSRLSEAKEDIETYQKQLSVAKEDLKSRLDLIKNKVDSLDEKLE